MAMTAEVACDLLIDMGSGEDPIIRKGREVTPISLLFDLSEGDINLGSAS